jgi:hypothetical protein
METPRVDQLAAIRVVEVLPRIHAARQSTYVYIPTCSTPLARQSQPPPYSYPSHVLPGHRRLPRLRHGRARWHRIGNRRRTTRYRYLWRVKESRPQWTDSSNSGRLQSHSSRLAALRQRSASRECLPRPGRHLRRSVHRGLPQGSTGSLRTHQHPLC